MPTYGYRCEKCATEFDVWQRMSDPAGAECPSCGGDGKRLFFPAGLVFKGSGFYKTDSRPAGGGSDSTPAKGDTSPKGGGTTPPPAADKPAPSSDS